MSYHIVMLDLKFVTIVEPQKRLLTLQLAAGFLLKKEVKESLINCEQNTPKNLHFGVVEKVLEGDKKRNSLAGGLLKVGFYIFLSCSPLDGFLEGGGPSGHGSIIGRQDKKLENWLQAPGQDYSS